MSRSLFLPALLLTLYSPAWADWQYTKWGMTPEQVLAGSGGVATTLPLTTDGPLWRSRATEPLLAAKWQTGNLPFTAIFFFSAPRPGNFAGASLSQVVVLLDDKTQTAIDSLRASLLERHGKPEPTLANQILEVKGWCDSGDVITFRRSPGWFFDPREHRDKGVKAVVIYEPDPASSL